MSDNFIILDTSLFKNKNICHGNDVAHTMSGSTNVPANGLIGATAGCNTCHFDTGGGTNGNTIGSYTFSGAGAHPTHNTTAATTYGDTGISSTAGQYNYGCANCSKCTNFYGVKLTLMLMGKGQSEIKFAGLFKNIFNLVRYK